MAEGFARFGEDEQYENTPNVFTPDPVRELQRVIDEGIAAGETRRVALELGLPLPDGEQ